jgi:hypothetical protein
VTVWSTLSWFVQLTLEPTVMVTVSGEYEKPEIATDAEAATAGAATTRGAELAASRAATTATARPRR